MTSVLKKEERTCPVDVAVRIRPLNEREKEGGQSDAWDVSNGETLALKDSLASKKKMSKRTRDISFTFDHIFGPKSETSSIYDCVVKDIVKSAMEGYHSSVFAYGQTSCGKTHTIHGSEGCLGIVELAVHDIFEYIKTCPTREYLLRVSYMEIYNESINDLLVPSSKNLDIYDHPKKGCVISGLLEEIVTSRGRIMEILATGDRHRKMSSTNYNQHSSRSHTVFRFVIESKARSMDGDSSSFSKTTRVSTLSLTDLAGSESLRLSGAVGTQRKEGSYINRSLLTLSMVIRALSGNQTKKIGVHVPYRNSKLTRILRSSLSGNSRVGVICCVTPGSENIEETLNTLDFAARAKTIEHKASINEVIDERALLQQYRSEIRDLRAQLEHLKNSGGGGLDEEEDLLAETNASKLAPPPILRRRQSSADYSREQLEEMVELEEMIGRIDHVILSANSMPPSPPRRCSKSFVFDDRLDGGEDEIDAAANGSKMDFPRLRRRSGSFQSTDMVVVEPSSTDKRLSDVSRSTDEDSDVPLNVSDLTEIKHKLSSLYRKKKSSRVLKKSSTAKKLLLQSVQHADSLFLQRELRERDQVIADMIAVMDAMETKVQELEGKRNGLEKENDRLKSDLDRLRHVLVAREEQIAAMRNEAVEEETF